MRKKAIRNLANLQRTASTARTLNLHSTWERFGDTQAYASAPLFENIRLNRAIILKHRLRRHETDIFSHTRTVATKVILPLDPSNLKAGGQYFFIGQRGYQAAVEQVVGLECDHTGHDMRLLALASLPSYDPFLLREALRRDGFGAADCYFQISQADTTRMRDFVRRELEPLVSVSFDGDVEFAARSAVLAGKVMSDQVDVVMDPLRVILQLNPDDFARGVFSWKGLIYYKWNFAALVPEVRQVLAELQSVQPRGHIGSETRRDLQRRRDHIQAALMVSLDAARVILAEYESAYEDLFRRGRPGAFRDFLLRAPDLFAELGDRLGAISHVASFWRYRFPSNQREVVDAPELAEILMDFADSLHHRDASDQLAA